MSIASTRQFAEATDLCPETILRMRRDPNGPFKQHRDWQYVGLGTRKIRWNKEMDVQPIIFRAIQRLGIGWQKNPLAANTQLSIRSVGDAAHLLLAPA